MKNDLISKLMNEVINYGGYAVTRRKAYADALEACLSQLPKSEPNREQRARLGAELFAFGSQARALNPEEAAKLIPVSEFAR